MEFIAGEDVSVLLKFTDKTGEPAIPDASSVVYTVRDNSGVAIAGLTAVALATGVADTQKTITVAAAENALGVGSRREHRAVQFRYTIGSEPYQRSINYTIRPWLNFSGNKDQVRSHLGIDRFELEDDEIDLTYSYFEIEDKVGQTDFETALASGTLTQIHANRAVVLHAAIQALPSLQFRAAQEERTSSNSFSRFQSVDFTKMRRDLQAALGTSLNIVNGETPVPIDIFSLSQQADPVTGA